jgi:hypothetical protein
MLSAVSVLVIVLQSSEIPEGLMNNPVLQMFCIFNNINCWVVTAQYVIAFEQICKCKVKNVPLPPCRHQGERRYSSYSFLASALDGVSGQRHTPAGLYPRRKDPWYPLNRRLGRPQTWSGHRGYRKDLSPLPGIESRSPDRPVCSQTLQWLSYSAHNYTTTAS